MKKALYLFLALAFVLALSACSYSNNPSSDSASNTPSEIVLSGTVNVNIQGFAFAPKDIVIEKGSTVVWTNNDSVPHDVTPNSGQAEPVKSARLSQGDSYSYTFNNSGTFSYFCSIHPMMKASITVK